MIYEGGSNMKDWFRCPVCNKKICMVDTSKHIEGVYCMCPKCKREIEIINNPIESKVQNADAS
ncbi:hypothetical protein UT300016_09560 [Clostridium senegalense]